MAEIDVLMPVYNGAAFVKESIDSILRQSFKDLRLIIVDDGSIDETPYILQACADQDKRILVVHRENGGIVAALNDGLRRVDSRYIFRMDADDIALPDRLSLQRDVLESRARMVMCGTQCDFFGTSVGPMKLPVKDSACRGRMLLFNPFAHSAVAMRTDVLARHGIQYRESYRLAEDYKLWSELSAFGEIGNLDRSLMRYRVHDKQSSREFLARQRAVHCVIASENLSAVGVPVGSLVIERFLSSQPSIRNDLDFLLKVARRGRSVATEFWKCSIRHCLGKYGRAFALRESKGL